MKRLCKGDDCYGQVDSEDLVKMLDGTLHPISELCWNCQGDKGRAKLKAYKKRLRHKANKKVTVGQKTMEASLNQTQ